ncbi:MAG: helix-turn-helix transcriptional regulator [Chitinophagaceae bacterium]|nr:helix-turn-helix transcriptional regulator [Chitinophagaceae bacterium]
MKEIIGKRIRKLRENKDYTQENMAAELGITPGAYAKIERGETDASISRLAQIAEILEVTMSSLFKEQFPGSTLEEQQNPYGFASKAEVEHLAQLIKQINRELERIRAEMNAGKKPRSKNST